MRPIKFRAWWKDTKKRIPDFMEEYVCDALNDESFIVSQFTGLHDKNGKEIYEGDILRLDGGAKDDVIGEVQYIDGCFCVKWNVVKSVPELKYYVGMEFCSIEVIGNIYENPELITSHK